MPGRKPKPTALKLVDGNPGKRKINRAEPKPKKTLDKPPADLKGEARKMWVMVIRDAPHGLLTTLDLAELKIYCQAYGLWMDALEKVKEQGGVVLSPEKLVPMQNPWLSIANRQAEIMMRSGANLGLSPSSRSKLTVQDVPPENSFDEFAA